MSEFTEVADRVWVARYEWCDVNVSLIEGERGLLVVDTHGSSRAAREVIGDILRLSSRPVVRIVNTHEHFDHVFGNAAFREEYGEMPITAHETAAANTVPQGELVKRAARGQSGERDAEVVQTPLVAADHTFSSVASIDLGDRAVELVHPGRGHTGGDLVVRLDDVDVLLAGDLVEESGTPAYGLDSFPLEWPWSLDLVLELVGTDTVVVPGHGAPVGREFVQDQRSAIGVVAQTIRDLAAGGVPLDQALESTEWPYPKELLVDALSRGYEQLPPGSRRLPLA